MTSIVEFFYFWQGAVISYCWILKIRFIGLTPRPKKKRFHVIFSPTFEQIIINEIRRRHFEIINPSLHSNPYHIFAQNRPQRGKWGRRAQ